MSTTTVGEIMSRRKPGETVILLGEEPFRPYFQDRDGLWVGLDRKGYTIIVEPDAQGSETFPRFQNLLIAPNYNYGLPRPWVFLAGGITGCPDWQADATRFLKFPGVKPSVTQGTLDVLLLTSMIQMLLGCKLSGSTLISKKRMPSCSGFPRIRFNQLHFSS